LSEGLSVFNVNANSDVGKALVEKISAGIEGLVRPWQIKRIASAQAEAEKIQALSQIEITELERRAVNRFVAEELKKQNNMESITEKAIPDLKPNAKPVEMNDDWITNFFDKCRIISDNEMQTLWAKILAGEANSPGSYSKRTVNLLGSLEKIEAQFFTTICRFYWYSIEPIILDYEASIYADLGINYSTLKHFDDIGLITFNSFPGYVVKNQPQTITVSYFEKTIQLTFKQPKDNTLGIGFVSYSNVGRQLSKICNVKPVDGFFDYVVKKWSDQGIKITNIGGE